MHRILFMPLLQIPSGHHHVADCIQEQLKQSADDFLCEKVELLSYRSVSLEKFISFVYLQWIQKFPSIYSKTYKQLAVKKEMHNKHYYLYEALFLKQVQQIIDDAKPDLVICTHALPSYLLNRMKKRNLWSGRIVNIYTDYFINDLWGMDGVDYHFIPCMEVKNKLLGKGVDPTQAIVTGIPIHPVFTKKRDSKEVKAKYNVLISGGNMGTGSIERLIRQLHPSGVVTYDVLCGKNERLFQTIKQMNHPSIKALGYIRTKEEMNHLYNLADAIITKPGGVTITECLWKKIPIFVYDALPGQEEINLNYLKSKGLIHHLDNWDTATDLEFILIEQLKNDSLHFQKSSQAFIDSIENHNIPQLIRNIL